MDTSKLNSLTTGQLRMINNAICDLLRSRSASESFEKTRKFQIGQNVQFQDKKGITRKINIDRVNMKSVSGIEIGGFAKWRVHPSFISALEI